MKKSLLILTTFLSVSSFSYANNLPVAYKQALSDLDIVGAELQGDFLSVTFNRDKIGKIMLESVITNICYQMYLDKKFAKELDLNRVMIVNKHYTHSFNFETDVKQYCNNISKLNDEQQKAQFPFDRYVSEN